MLNRSACQKVHWHELDFAVGSFRAAARKLEKFTTGYDEAIEILNFVADQLDTAKRELGKDNYGKE